MVPVKKETTPEVEEEDSSSTPANNAGLNRNKKKSKNYVAAMNINHDLFMEQARKTLKRVDDSLASASEQRKLEFLNEMHAQGDLVEDLAE